MKRRTPPDIKRIDLIWLELAGVPLWRNGLKALENYIALLDFATVEEAVVTSAERDGTRFDRWRYCCGILRSKLAEQLAGKEQEGETVGR